MNVNGKRGLLIGFALLIVLLYALSCGPSLGDVMDAQMGKNISEVVDDWGPPDSIAPDGRGGGIWIWYEEHYINYVDPNGNLHTSTVTTKKCFWVNRSGIIYSWRWENQ